MAKQTGVKPPGYMPIMPVGTTREGGFQAGSFVIDNMNTAPLMQYYKNIENMWANVNTFGQDLLSTIYKWKDYEYKKWKAKRKERLLASLSQAGNIKRQVEQDRIDTALRAVEDILQTRREIEYKAPATEDLDFDFFDKIRKLEEEEEGDIDVNPA